MTETLWTALRGCVERYAGLEIPPSRKGYVEARVRRRMEHLGMSGFEQYLAYIQAVQGEEELATLVEELTVNETYFFRHVPHLEWIERDIVPQLARRGGPVRIWSAACSTGEEIYSVAIWIAEYIRPKYPGLQFELWASDIDRKALERAQEARYSEYAVRRVPPRLRMRYFEAVGEKMYRLCREKLTPVRFQKVNLVQPRDMARLPMQDVIFCANVLIYFRPEIRTQVVENLGNKLNKEGFLFLGFSESLYGITTRFESYRKYGTLGYRRREAEWSAFGKVPAQHPIIKTEGGT